MLYMLILEALFERAIWYRIYKSECGGKFGTCTRGLATCHGEKMYQGEVEQLEFCLMFFV